MTETIARNRDLKQILIERRREMQNDVQGRIREAIAGRAHEVRDDLEHADADIQGDLDFTLLQQRAEALARIDEALLRLEAGKYGFCFACEEEISERRLRAMPFAVRCQTCEGKREQEQGRAARQLALRRGGVSFVPDAVNS